MELLKSDQSWYSLIKATGRHLVLENVDIVLKFLGFTGPAPMKKALYFTKCVFRGKDSKYSRRKNNSFLVVPSYSHYFMT